MGLKVASKLLNGESKSMAKALMDIRYVPRSQIMKNPKNRVSIDGIEELAQDIRMAGLEQPLVVYPKDGAYMLLTGERRITAIDMLIENGDWDPAKELIPCIERPLDMYKLPLDDDLKERYAILRTNAFSRRMTDADKMAQAEDYGKIIKELKSRGYKEMIIGFDENGDPVKQDITGRRRETVAKMVGISTGQVGKIENILNNGSDQLKEAVRNGDVNITAADKLASFSEEEQDEFLESKGDSKVTAASVISSFANQTTGIEYPEQDGYNEDDYATPEELGIADEYYEECEKWKNTYRPSLSLPDLREDSSVMKIFIKNSILDAVREKYEEYVSVFEFPFGTVDDLDFEDYLSAFINDLLKEKLSDIMRGRINANAGKEGLLCQR